MSGVRALPGSNPGLSLSQVPGGDEGPEDLRGNGGRSTDRALEDSAQQVAIGEGPRMLSHRTRLGCIREPGGTGCDALGALMRPLGAQQAWPAGSQAWWPQQETSTFPVPPNTEGKWGSRERRQPTGHWARDG